MEQCRSHCRRFQSEMTDPYIFSVFFKGVAFFHQLAQRLQILIKITAKVAAQNNLTIKQHTQIITGSGKIFQKFFKPFAGSRLSFPQPAEKIRKAVRNPLQQRPGRAISVYTSPLAAITQPAVRLNSHMPKFAAPLVIAGIKLIINKNGAAHRIAERKIDDIAVFPLIPHFCSTGCVRIVAHDARKRDIPRKLFQGSPCKP